MDILVNGIHYQIEKDMTLLRFLRDVLKLEGTKDGCSEGACGACTVIIDGKAQRACVQKLSRLEGKSIITIEGLTEKEKDIYSYAFAKAGAVQCGYWTPGIVMSAKALLDVNPEPTREDVKKAIRGNICRCTGYKKIEEAILMASTLFKEEKRDEERESEWRELVSKTLGDVLPRTKGPLFSTSTAPFISNVELPGIKALEDFRKYPYTPRSVSGKKVVSSLLSASGFLVGEKNADDAFPTADGFDYQMKMRILEKAEKERDEYAILIEDWNGRNALGLCDMLIKKEGDDKVIFLHKSIDVSTIYKLTLIPRAFL